MLGSQHPSEPPNRRSGMLRRGAANTEPTGQVGAAALLQTAPLAVPTVALAVPTAALAAMQRNCCAHDHGAVVWCSWNPNAGPVVVVSALSSATRNLSAPSE